MSNFTRQNEVNLATCQSSTTTSENSNEKDKFPCITNTECSPDTKITVMRRSVPATTWGEVKLTEPSSAEILGKVV